MARHIRAEDRNANIEFYPKLTYPEVYILDGGYSNFFKEHRRSLLPAGLRRDGRRGACEHVRARDGRLRQNRKGLNRPRLSRSARIVPYRTRRQRRDVPALEAASLRIS